MDQETRAALAAQAGLVLPARRTNKAGIDLIKSFEGLKLTAYLCPGHVWSIGYGHTRTVRPGMTITPGEAEQLLLGDLDIVQKAIQRRVSVPLTDNEFAALVSFVFNVGVPAFENSSLLKLLNRGWYDQVPAQLMRWNRAKGELMGGLARRRAAEAALWNKRDEPELLAAPSTETEA